MSQVALVGSILGIFLFLVYAAGFGDAEAFHCFLSLLFCQLCGRRAVCFALPACRAVPPARPCEGRGSVGSTEGGLVGRKQMMKNEKGSRYPKSRRTAETTAKKQKLF